jgi:hypothetical protein
MATRKKTKKPTFDPPEPVALHEPMLRICGVPWKKTRPKKVEQRILVAYVATGPTWKARLWCHEHPVEIKYMTRRVTRSTRKRGRMVYIRHQGPKVAHWHCVIEPLRAKRVVLHPRLGTRRLTEWFVESRDRHAAPESAVLDALNDLILQARRAAPITRLALRVGTSFVDGTAVTPSVKNKFLPTFKKMTAIS